MGFSDYSKQALEQVVEQAPGKPFRNEKGEVIGDIESATLIKGTKTIEFTIALR
jgi:hypothetical protein